jgi:hypothetical protein
MNWFDFLIGVILGYFLGYLTPLAKKFMKFLDKEQEKKV